VLRCVSNFFTNVVLLFFMGAYMKSLFKITAISVIALSSVPALSQNLIANGGFELPGMTAPYSTLFAGDTTGLPSWTVTTGSIDIVRTPYPVSEQSQAIDLVGTGTNTGGVSQSFATVAGQDYHLSFDYLNNTDNPNSMLSAIVNVAGGALNKSWTVSYSGGTVNSGYMSFSGYFNAKDVSTLLSFTDQSHVANQGLFIDNVSVAAVPEASTWAMMIMGVGAVGAGMRRRNKLGMGSTKLANA